ncbi:hypothetical protein [Planktotalea sp.]|uniref:hypothetical protein n=1 Tax=Planktotalea sp. TaxID=2029877 RepID=UPI0025D2DE20|nr:hypothetical protein [Planktotalea sp.]
MPVFSNLAYSNTDLGRPACSISTGTFTVASAGAIINVLDNDSVFDDESTGGGQAVDSSQQVLDSAFDGSYVAGRFVRSAFQYNVVTNNTKGDTGTA